jgi:hypothetical protein
MTTKSKARRTKDQVVDVTEKGAAGAVGATQEAADQVTGEVRGEVRGKLIREAPYAARGLGNVVVEATRDVDADGLPERLRRTPGAVASKVGGLGDDAKSTYVALAVRGRGEKLRDAGESSATAAGDAASSALGGSEDPTDGGGKAKELGSKVTGAVKHAATLAGTKAMDTVGKVKSATGRSSSDEDDAGDDDADGTTGSAATEEGRVSAARGKAKSAAGRVKGAASRTATSARGRTKGAATEAEEQAEKLDVGSGPFEKRTVTQLRNRASELGIEGRAAMKKKDLVQAIRDAT